MGVCGGSCEAAALRWLECGVGVTISYNVSRRLWTAGEGGVGDLIGISSGGGNMSVLEPSPSEPFAKFGASVVVSSTSSPLAEPVLLPGVPTLSLRPLLSPSASASLSLS